MNTKSSKKIYFPHIKTTPAELKAFYNLSPQRKVYACPILELTRGVGGKMELQLERIKDYIGSQDEFILDLTQDETFQDATIKDLQHMHADGYKKWIQFLRNTDLSNMIPSLVGSLKHLSDFEKQIRFFDKYFNGKFAYRVPISLNDDISDLEIILQRVLIKNIENSKRVYLLLDFGEVNTRTFSKFFPQIIKVKEILERVEFEGIVLPMFSSYHSVPPTNPKERDGIFEIDDCPLLEFKLQEEIIKSKLKCTYSDYAFIQPTRKVTGGGIWYPRIDFPSKERCYWVRCFNKKKIPSGSSFRVDMNPTNEVAYRDAAQRLVSQSWFRDNKVDCWGIEQIEAAVSGGKIGKSPQHWIAVRSNIHMSRVIDHITGQDLI